MMSHFSFQIWSSSLIFFCYKHFYLLVKKIQAVFFSNLILLLINKLIPLSLIKLN